jgi:hypothetical protein
MSKLRRVLSPRNGGDALRCCFGRCRCPRKYGSVRLQMTKFWRFSGSGLLRVNYARTRRGFVLILWNCARTVATAGVMRGEPRWRRRLQTDYPRSPFTARSSEAQRSNRSCQQPESGSCLARSFRCHRLESCWCCQSTRWRRTTPDGRTVPFPSERARR